MPPHELCTPGVTAAVPGTYLWYTISIAWNEHPLVSSYCCCLHSIAQSLLLLVLFLALQSQLGMAASVPGMPGMPAAMPGLPGAPAAGVPGYPSAPGLPGAPGGPVVTDPMATPLPTPFICVTGMVTADVLANDDEYREVRAWGNRYRVHCIGL